MKVLKGFFLVIIVFILIWLLIAGQLLLMVQNTLLSANYFEKAYNRSGLDEAITELIETQIEDFSSTLDNAEGSKNMEDLGSIIDADEIEDTAEELIKGLFSYLSGQKRSLPTLDMSAYKEMMVTLISEQMQAFGGIQDLEVMLEFILDDYNELAKTPHGTLDEDAVRTMSEYTEYEALGYDMLSFIIETNFGLDESLSDSERADEILNAFIAQELEIDQINDELDLNDLMDELYPDGSPIEFARDILLAIKQTLLTGILVLIGIFILIVILTAFTPSSSFGWLSAPLIGAGLFGLSSGVSALFIPQVAQMASRSISFDSFGASEQVIEFVQSFINGSSLFLLIEGAVLLVVGIVFAVIAGRLAKNKKETKKSGWLIAVRIVLVILLLVCAVYAATWYFGEFADTIEASVEAIERSTQSLDDSDIMRAISEVIGIDLEGFMGGN